MVMLVAPGFDSVATFAWLWPTRTLPKDKDDGVTAKLPAATALPDTAISPVLGTLLWMEIFPAGLPVVCGPNAIVKVALCPGAKEIGRTGPVTRKAGSDDAALVMVAVTVE